MSETKSIEPESANDGCVQRVFRRPHPWQHQLDANAKLKAARAIAAKRRSLKNRHDDIEYRRMRERQWHRLKDGVPLEAPLLKSGRPKTVKPNADSSQPAPTK